MYQAHTYAGNPLDRGERERRDEGWISAKSRDSTSRFLPMSQLKVFMSEADGGLGWLRRPDLDRIGVDGEATFLGLMEGIPHFVVDITQYEGAAQTLTGGAIYKFEDARAAAGQLSATDASIVAQARAQLDWHGRHGFCSVCGHETLVKRGGQVRKCPGCQADHFPRTDPVVITVVSNEDTCLLGQNIRNMGRSKMYSALAGFMDQGESIEEAVAREVMEEAGIRVKNVRYHSSQPWPFPSSLMIGCHADAATTDIAKDDEEMTDVRWFPRPEVLLALEEKSEELTVPGPFAIAHHLIKSWALGS